MPASPSRMATLEQDVRRLKSELHSAKMKIDHLQGENKKLTVDISAKETLPENEEQIRLFFEHIPSSLAMFDREMRYLHVSRRWRSDYGLSDKEILGESHYEIFPEIPADWREAHRRGLSGEVIRAEGDRFERIDGSVQWVRWEIWPWYDSSGKVGGIVIFTEDITARKRAEAEMAQSRAEFQAIFNSISDAIVFVDQQRQIMMVNPAFEAMFGYQLADLTGQTTQIIYADPDSYQNQGKQRFNQNATISQPIFENAYRRRDGTIFPGETMGNKVTREDGKLLGFLGVIRDVTSRKQADKKLQETEQKLRLLVKHSTNLFYMHTPDNLLTYVSPQSKQFFDCEPEEAMVRWTELITDNPLNRDAILATQQAIDTGRRQPPYQIECIGKKGRKIWVEAHEAPIVENGVTVGISGTLTDITEKKKTEEALHSSRNLLHTILENVPILVFWKDPSLNYLGCNTGFARSAGFARPEDLLGKDDFQMGWREQAEFYRTVDKLVMDSKTPKIGIEKQQTTPDGQTIWVRTSKVPLFDAEGNIIGLLGIDEDITERKQVEEKLRESEFFFKESQRLASIGSYKADLIAGYWSSSEVLDEIFGIGPDYDRSIQGWFARVHPDDREMMEHYLNKEVIAQRKTFDKEYRIIRDNDGKTRWVSGLGALKTDADGRDLLLMGTIQDITEQKEREEAEAKLEAQVHQTQKIESIGQLAGGVAHDFNNMLGVILGHAELALRKADLASPFISDLEEIRKAANRSAELTGHLLTFARKQVISPKVLDLNDAVAGTLKMLQRLIGENILLSWNPAANLWPVKVDPSQINQILTNLCVNSRDAISGTGNISIKTANTSWDEVAIASRPYDVVPGDYVLLSVSDDGCGMGKKVQAHIFEPFYTTKEIGSGTGLGLATVYGAVKQNLGFFTVYSEPGLGTVFNIYFPRTSKAVEVKQEKAEKPLLRGTETVLLVEDDEMLLRLVTSMLEESGYTVMAAITTDLAQTLAKEHPGPIHLLISDMIMPVMNGKELSDKLQPLRPEMKVLFLSGYTAEIISKQGVIEGEIHFLQKPFSFEALTAKVRGVLDGH